MENCYGCGACCNVCPAGAIDMKENKEGFLEPFIDEEKCISCEKCKKVCPSVNCLYSNDPEPDIFAFSAEEKILYNSSSGGIFSFLAEYILQAGGYVVGAAYDSQFLVNHVMIHSIEELDKIRRSKYLQSATGDTYKKTKELLEMGEYVLYSGCPCQIAGLLRFLGKDYVEKANESIRGQIEERMKKGEAFFAPEEGGFETIEAEPDFYVNEKGNPVIVFEKYAIAPGAMGEVEFEIAL